MIYLKLLMFIAFLTVGALILGAVAEAGYDPTIVLVAVVLLLFAILKMK